MMFKGNFCILQIVSVLLQHFSSRTRWGYSIFLSCVSAPLGQIDLFSCGNSRIQWSSLRGSQTWHALWEMKFAVNAAWAFIPRPQFHFLAPWLWREWRNALFSPSEKFNSVRLGRYFLVQRSSNCLSEYKQTGFDINTCMRSHFRKRQQCLLLPPPLAGDHRHNWNIIYRVAMPELMLQKFPFSTRVPTLMRLSWYSADGSVPLEECQTASSTFWCAVIAVI